MTAPSRSFLFVPGDNARKLAKAEEADADALILDLEDAVALDAKRLARDQICAFLRDRPAARRSSQLWVRVNSLDTDLALADLAAVVAGEPDGIMLPKADGPADVLRLSHYLEALEAQAGITVGTIRVRPVATETAIAPFNLGGYAGAGLARLAGLTWGAEDLSAAIGASTNLDASGGWALTYRMVRSLTLLAARAAGVPAIDTLHVDFRDEDGLRATSQASRAEGFGGRIAIHPAQVAAINESYMPSPAEIEHAQRVIAAFEATAGAGVATLDGCMIDIPHLKQARGVLAQIYRR